jgi:hypothetical protein
MSSKLKQTTKAIWRLGDYCPIATLLEPAAHEVVDALSGLGHNPAIT